MGCLTMAAPYRIAAAKSDTAVDRTFSFIRAVDTGCSAANATIDGAGTLSTQSSSREGDGVRPLVATIGCVRIGFALVTELVSVIANEVRYQAGRPPCQVGKIVEDLVRRLSAAFGKIGITVEHTFHVGGLGTGGEDVF